MIKFKKDEGWMLLMCMLRYSLGRHTYIVGWCRNIIERNWKELEQHQQEQIQREIKEYFEIWKPEINCIDYKEWKKVLELNNG